jgi:hypothetical protein
MVRALLDGRKTQTRRIFKGAEKNENGLWHVFGSGGGVIGVAEEDVGNEAVGYLPIQVGDRLWVREAWRTLQKWDDLKPSHLADDASKITYEADPENRNKVWAFGKLRPSMFMPRFASRLTLTVTEVRVERLQDISEEDARAEGCPVTWDGKPYDPPPPEVDSWQGYGRYSFCLLWSKINGPGSWDANPWVAAYTFTVERRNIDEVAHA